MCPAEWHKRNLSAIIKRCRWSIPIPSVKFVEFWAAGNVSRDMGVVAFTPQSVDTPVINRRPPGNITFKRMQNKKKAPTQVA